MDGFLHHLNNMRPTIKLTLEVEEDRSLHFLDTKLTRKEEGELDITVYLKQMHADRYLHFWSHYPAHVKRGTVRCLYDRARCTTV